jgi:hypothetical protein
MLRPDDYRLWPTGYFPVPFTFEGEQVIVAGVSLIRSSFPGVGKLMPEPSVTGNIDRENSYYLFPGN